MPVNPCPRCGTPIPVDSDALDTDSGVENSGAPSSDIQCPRCLLRPPWDKPHPIAITLGPGQSFLPPSIEELSGHITGYEVEALIGQGGMGAVYLGRQKSLDRRVAIKILPPQIATRAGFRERFGQEGRALAKLNHPNIVAVYDFGQAGPYAMLVMELVEGANLREVLAQGRLSPAEALEIIPQLCDALSYAHDEGVVHRDIKPENLLFDGRGRLKITDFGLAKLVSSKTAADAEAATTATDAARTPDPTQGVVGTVHYMAPEQLENPGSVDNRADIYAMGVVFYEMLTGELPIGRFEPPSRLVTGTSPQGLPAIAIDVRLDEVVLRALEKHPEKRYGSASALMHDIDEIEKGPRSSVTGKILPEKHRRRVKDTVHRAGEAAGSFASASMEATGDWVSRAKATWMTDPRVELPAYIAMAVVVFGSLTAFVIGDSPAGGDTAALVVFVTCILAAVFSRISLAREDGADREHSLLSTRFILGALYIIVAVPLLLSPALAAFSIWIEIYDFPRDVGELGWVRDWTQVLSITTMVTASAWLMLLVLHVVFPIILTTLFRPFVSAISARIAIPLAVLLVVLIGIGPLLMRQVPYKTYTPGIAVAEEDWEKLSPRDFKELQIELRRENDMYRRQLDASRSDKKRVEH